MKRIINKEQRRRIDEIMTRCKELTSNDPEFFTNAQDDINFLIDLIFDLKDKLTDIYQELDELDN